MLIIIIRKKRCLLLLPKTERDNGGSLGFFACNEAYSINEPHASGRCADIIEMYWNGVHPRMRGEGDRGRENEGEREKDICGN